MEVRVCGIMTCPRYSLTLTRNYIDRAFKAAGIPLRIKTGVFYGQCMQSMLNDCLNDGADFAVTVDFDSLFGAHHIKRLLSVIAANPHIDALASFQARRGMKYPLFTVAGQGAVQFEGAPLQVTTAHFGLTAIRLKSLEDVAKPWFQGQPGPETGEYDETRIDDDIWFWRQWQAAGKSVYVDSGCRIGHVEEMVAYYTPEGEHSFAYPQDFITESVTCDDTISEVQAQA
jgi:hypothetical protein